MKDRQTKKRSRKWQSKMLSLLLSGMLLVTGVDAPVMLAAEGNALKTKQLSRQEETAAEPEEQSADAQEAAFADAQAQDTAQETNTAQGKDREEQENASAKENTEGSASEARTEQETNASEARTEQENATTEVKTQEEQETDASEARTEQENVTTEVKTQEEQETDVTEAQTEQENVSTEVQIQEEQETVKTEMQTQIEEETDESESAAEMEKDDGGLEDNDTFDVLEERTIIVVNPLYEDVISPEELAKQLKSLQIRSLNEARSTTETFQTFEGAVDYLRTQMAARETNVSIQVPLSVSEENKGEEGFVKTLLAAAVAHTEECSGQEGDALAWQYGGAQMAMSSSSAAYTVNYTISYYTTYEQEEELTAKVNEAIESLALTDKTDYQKVKAIHDYICDNVDYDYENLNVQEHKIKYTAYGALCMGKAVCQGYAVAFYRMCKEAGLPVRVITGIGNGGAHAWNIVKIDGNTRTEGKYYNIDCTWDGQDKETYYTYFLLNEEDFVDHIRDENYADDEFYAQYPMAETSYIDESSLETGLNKENPELTFTTIDDTTVSSTAEEKPKLLIFFRTDCGNSINTIQAAAGYDFQGVDVYAVDIDGKTKSEVEKFKADYGSDNITFCYGSPQNNNLYSYFEAAGLVNGNSISYTLPVLCYIDSNNLFQHITQGMQNATQIETNLKFYCGTTLVKQYKITYVLNGGTNNRDNPSVFKETSDTIVLKDPTKEGYTFAGWYLDEQFTQKVAQIDRGMARDITLYAKWTVEEAADKLNLDNLDISFTNLEEESVSSKANGKPKLIIFFSIDCGNSQQTIQGIRNGLENVDIMAICTTKNSKEEVQNFKDTYGSDAIVFSYDDYGVQNSGYLNDYVDLANHSSITPPIICYIDANNKLQHIINGYRSADAIKADIDAYCSALAEPAPSETYRITYELDGGTNNENNPAAYTQDTETISLQNPTKEGFTFAGWYRDAEFTIAISEIVKGSSGNLTLYAKWISETQEPDDGEIKPFILGNGTTVTLDYDTFSYNGKEQKPEVTVSHNNKTLVLDTEYTLSYDNNLNAGTASVTVTGINAYQGTVTKNFTILPAELVITAQDKILYAGAPKPSPETYEYQVEGLAEGDNLLTPPTFTCDVSNPVQKGIYEIIPSGAKSGVNYNADITYQNGKLTVEEKYVNDKDDSQYPSDKRKDLNSLSASITNIKSKVYDGNPYMPTVKVTVIEGNKKVTLTQGADYRVIYENNINAGSGKVIVRGNGVYKGEISKEFNITKKPVKKLKVVTGGMAANQVSNFPVYVYDGTKLLKEDIDYKLSSLTDIKSTSAKVTIIAAQDSNYEGSVKAKITLYNTEASMIINPENVTLSEETAIYTGKAIKSIEPTVKINDTLLEKNKHYKVQYKNNTNAGDAYIIITGKGQYKGKVVKSFTITPIKTDLTIKEIPQKTYNGKLQKPALTVKAGNKKLKANKDYSIVYENNLHKGTAAVWVEGKGNYAGTNSNITFTINAQKISKASVKGTKAKGITLTYNKKALGEGIDYTLEYGEEKNGKVQIIIKGIGDFTGELKKSVKMDAAAPSTNVLPAVSNNIGKQNYTRWSEPVTSYLTKNDNGAVTRVEYIKDKVYVETYSADRKLLDQKKILVELPLFGGFYAGKNNNFLVFGQENPKEDDGVEVIRVVKYDKDWNRQGAASLFGANTAQPFWAGSLSITECEDMLYVRTCHKMYKSEDGLNHQANMALGVKISKMEITDQLSYVTNAWRKGYVSHSFKQLFITDGSDLIAVDHGDAYPRAVVMGKYDGKAGSETFIQDGYCDSIDVLPIQGKVGANDTGVSIGGLEASDTAYLVAGNSVAQDNAEKYNASGVRNIFVTSTQKNNFTSEGTTVYWITNYTNKSSVAVSTPQLVKLNNHEFLLMWTEGNHVKCVVLNALGEPVTEIFSVKGALSDCQPILLGEDVFWYYTDNSKPVFCSYNKNK